MHSRDIAWLTVAGLLSLKILSGLAVAGEPVQPAAPANIHYAVHMLHWS